MDSVVLRELFGPESGYLMEELCKQQNEELYVLYISPGIIPVTK